MKNKIIVLILWFIPGLLAAQHADISKLFVDEAPLEIKLRIEMKDVKGNPNDTVYYQYVMHYKDKDTWDSIKIEVRARGNFRRKECYYPPLRIKIKKHDAEGTVFEGNKSLKLVMPCKPTKDNSLIMKEYVCYQMYEPITPYTFNTRLVNIEFLDLNNKKAKPVQFRGFFIEDDDVVAKRHHGKVLEDVKLHPKFLNDSSAVRHDIFQYMIANTDWSTTFMHNAKLMQLTDSKKYIPLAYDFDMAGFVSAPYASVSEQLPISSVRERLFRGFCRPESVFQAIRKEYIAKEGAIKESLKRSETDFDPREFSAMMKYMDEFFATMKNDKTFKAEIISKCRTN
jgi:hypothetical protein